MHGLTSNRDFLVNILRHDAFLSGDTTTDFIDRVKPPRSLQLDAEELELAAQTDREEIMGVRHRELPLEGVQFHPESVLTPDGERLMTNFLRMTKA